MYRSLQSICIIISSNFSWTAIGDRVKITQLVANSTILCSSLCVSVCVGAGVGVGGGGGVCMPVCVVCRCRCGCVCVCE